MKKILFLIHDLGQGGAEKVLINLVNNLDKTKYEVTLMTLFNCGENKQFLNSNIKYKYWFNKMIPANSHLMKLLSPKQLHKLIIKEKYDIEVSYLEGPCARVISGCTNSKTKLISWIHIEQHTEKKVASSFRSIKEAKKCYEKFNKIVCVSETVKNDFINALCVKSNYEVLYNTNETKKILILAKENTDDIIQTNAVKIVGVGKLLKNKGFDRVLKIIKKLVDEKYNVHFYILGEGPERGNLLKYIDENKLNDNVTLLGYQLNPYKYIAKCDLFVCASYAEGFSTAATEALIVGTPICTVEVSGMKEMLGSNNEYGIVTENNDNSLYMGIKYLLDDKSKLDYYKEQAKLRGKDFSTEETVNAVESMFDLL